MTYKNRQANEGKAKRERRPHHRHHRRRHYVQQYRTSIFNHTINTKQTSLEQMCRAPRGTPMQTFPKTSTTSQRTGEPETPPRRTGGEEEKSNF